MGFGYPRKRRKKPEDLKRHFSMRCIQRIGIGLDSEELKRRMKANLLVLSWRESNTKVHYIVPSNMLPAGFKREVEAVYDSSKHEFVTVLFKDGKEYEEFLEDGIDVREWMG